MRHLIYKLIGSLALVLASVGLVLPLLPTTPFVLLAAWAFARGAPSLHARIDRHPRFGPLLRDWENRRAIPRSGKACAIIGLTGSWTLLAVTAQSAFVLAMAGGVMLVVGAYVVSRPA